MQKNIYIIGSGLSGLVATTELLKKGYTITMLDQEWTCVKKSETVNL